MSPPHRSSHTRGAACDRAPFCSARPGLRRPAAPSRRPRNGTRARAPPHRRSVLPLPRLPLKRCFGFLIAMRRSDSVALPILDISFCFCLLSFSALRNAASLRSPVADGERARASEAASRRVAERSDGTREPD
eukprot:CAMPEP_0185309802 /NCGR_PEP_ID=MMETSP1363-20130426/22629_1 /TAXON_ID=38817 /ORGANISM="Gephyrocapsa oceanica, Strain RCC1303" /LENGTH=132 /DNA_ID=CAMNT_0027907313 /DNA_START=100 /DNA_END=495 /DNA_ORIENTATION=-